MSDARQRHRGRILDLSKLVEDGVDAADHGGEGHNALSQPMQGRVGHRWLESLSLRIFIIVPRKVSHDVCNRFERPPQIPHLIFFQMGILQPDSHDGLANVEEKLHGKIVLLFFQATELPYLVEPFVYLTAIGGEGYFVYLFLAQCAEAAAFQLTAYLVETKLMFEVVRINHAAKVRKSERFSK